MKPFRYRSMSVFGLLLVLHCIALDGAAQSPELIVEVDRQQIYQGESITYRVTLNHVEMPTAPVLDASDKFQVEVMGERSLNSQQITIINGRRTEVVRHGRQYSYRLTPHGSGQLTIPAPQVEVDGQVLTGREIAIRVIAPKEQDNVVLQVALDRESVFPMQPFTVTLTIAVKELPGSYSARDPLSIQSNPPQLIVPWFDDGLVPDGLEPKRSWRDILEPLVERRGRGLQINQIGGSSAFSFFGRESTAFLPPAKNTQRVNADGKSIGYVEYQLARSFVGKTIGKYSLGPVTLKGMFATRTNGAQLVGEDLYVMAPKIEVVVKDVPQAGRPDSYIGAIGTFDVTAQISPTTVKVGDPMTLIISLTGDGTLDAARPPKIESLSQIASAFRTYEATEEVDHNTKKFTYSLRPLDARVTEFPSIPISIFDVASERYISVDTKPISIRIAETDRLTAGDIVSNSRLQASPELKLSQGGLFANHSDLSALRNDVVNIKPWVGLWLTLIVGYAGLTLGLNRYHRLRSNPAIARRRSARSTAQAQLRTIVSGVDDLSPSQLSDQLSAVITGLIADYTGIAATGLTSRDAATILKRFELNSGLISRTETFLQCCDDARFGGGALDARQLLADCKTLLDELPPAWEKAQR